MAGTLRDKLNPIYQRLFARGTFDTPAVEEPRATCDNCAMCDHGQAAPVAMGFFKPSTKCCTWEPTLLNFLVGAVLTDEGPDLEEGRRRLRQRIATRQGINPFAVMPSAKYRMLYHAASTAAFGRSELLRCPYYSDERGGACTVWQYREAVCATYFCKYQDGKAGRDYWTAVKGYLNFAEGVLAINAMRSLSPAFTLPTFAVKTLTLEELEDRAPSDEQYAALWGDWAGREEELYRRCYAYVQDLTPERFSTMIDRTPNGQQHLATVTARRADIEKRKVLPLRLVRAGGISVQDRGEEVLIAPYNPYDAFALDRDLFAVLAKLDGKQTLAQNLERLEKEEGVELTPDLLQYLYTHGVLAEPAPPKPPPPGKPLTKQLQPKTKKDKARSASRR